MVLVKLGAKLDNITKKFANVEKSSKKVLSSIMTRKGQIFLSLLFMDFQPLKEYNRDELATRIAEKLAVEIEMDRGDMLSDFEREHSQSPNSNRLSEVLKILKDNKFLSRTVGNKKTKDKEYRGPKKRGPVSVYRLSPEAVRIKKLLDKPEVVDILINGLTDSGLLHLFLKSALKCSLYMIKNGDKKLVSKSFYLFAANKSEEISFVTEQIQVLNEKLKDVNDKEMDKKAEDAAGYLLPKMTDYISRMALMYGVSELD